MWVIVSSWRLRGYCRRKWPSWIQVALSIPLPDPRLALPRRSLALRPLFLSPRCPPRSSPPSALFAPSNRSFRLAFPSFVHAQHLVLRCFPSLLPCTNSILSFADPSSPPREGRQSCKHFSPLFHLFSSSPFRSSPSNSISSSSIIPIDEHELRFPRIVSPGTEKKGTESNGGRVGSQMEISSSFLGDHVFSAVPRNGRSEE